jgi:hypothetical protein
LDFEIRHEFDIPLDALELALLSPALLDRLRERSKSLEACEQKSSSVENNQLRRVWYFRMNAPVPKFAQGHVTREMLAWDQSTTYDLLTHQGTWTIDPAIKQEWKRFFIAKGVYELVPTKTGTARIVKGEVSLALPAVGLIVERLIVSDVRRNFESEAETLRTIATLA